MKHTYLLGAGASYNQIPVVNEFSSHWKGFLKTANEILKQIPQINIQQELLVFMKNFSDTLQNYRSFDTYARYLSFQPDSADKLTGLKIMLDFFVSYISFNTVLSDPNQSNLNNKSKDHRISGLIIDLAHKGSKEYENDIHPDFQILTWNYDMLINNAVRLLKGGDFHYFKSPKLIHLNSNCNFFNFLNSSDEHKKIIENDPSNLKMWGEYLVFLYNQTDHLKFAWEESQEEFKKRLATITPSDNLVIVGYSFPFYNKEYDKLIFEKILKSNFITNFFIQDPNYEIVLNSVKYFYQNFYDPIINLSTNNEYKKIIASAKIEATNNPYIFIPDEFSIQT